MIKAMNDLSINDNSIKLKHCKSKTVILLTSVLLFSYTTTVLFLQTPFKLLVILFAVNLFARNDIFEETGEVSAH